MRVLFSPAHYVYGDSWEGSEISWAYDIADRIGSQFPGSVVITGRSTVDSKPYRIVELTPHESRVNFGLLNALAFNMRYTLATFRALRGGRFDLVHHVLPFALGKTYNLAALRHGATTPFIVGPVQPPIETPDADVDRTDLSKVLDAGDRKASVGRRVGSFASEVVAPFVFGRLSNRTVDRAAAVVAVNDEARALLLRRGASPERVVVIPKGVDTGRFVHAREGENTSAEIELLSVSRLLKRKNVDVIVRAFAKVAADSAHVSLRIVGDGAEREALTRLVQDLGVGAKVTFTGALPYAEVHEAYRRAHIFVNASSAEGFATTCLEALASGLPVVSTRVGGFVDAVEDGRNGFLIGAPDGDELAAALGRLAADRTLIERLSASARERAEREFDWDRAVIPRYLDLYDRVTDETAGRSR